MLCTRSFKTSIHISMARGGSEQEPLAITRLRVRHYLWNGLLKAKHRIKNEEHRNFSEVSKLQPPHQGES